MRIITTFLFPIFILFGVTRGADDPDKGIYQQCQDRMAVCVGIPRDCWSGSLGSCQVMAIIQPNSDKSKVLFKLVGMNIPGWDTYIGIGIAVNGQGMSDTNMILCTNTNNMELYWSQTTTTPNPIGNPAYFKKMANDFSSGKIICKFELDSKFTQSEVEFDLGSKDYAVLLAEGNFNRNSKLPQKHGDIYARTDPMSLTTAGSVDKVASLKLFTIALLAFVIVKI